MSLASVTPTAFDSFPDEDLIVRFQQGQDGAFTAIVRRFKDPLTNFVYRFVGDLDTANDVVQETFLRVYQRKHSYNQVSRFSNWLYTIASNLAKSELRRVARSRNTSLNAMPGSTGADAGSDDAAWDVPDTAPMPDTRVDTTLHMQQIQKALMKISPSYREIIILRDIQDLSYEEISEVTGLELGTVKSRINRGRAQLQGLLGHLRPEPGVR